MTTFTIILLISALLIVWFILSYKKTILYRDILIISKGSELKSKIPYLIRYTLLSCKFFTIKIHKALISDPNEPHDHPWNYLSIILRGGYYEQTTREVVDTPLFIDLSKDFTPMPTRVIKEKTWYKPGSILYRKGDKLHKLIIPNGKYCISLIFTFKKWRK